jgi:hypothetical protein
LAAAGRILGDLAARLPEPFGEQDSTGEVW